MKCQRGCQINLGINFGKKMTKIVSSLKFKSQGGHKFSFFAATKTASVIWCSRHRFIDLWMTNAWNYLDYFLIMVKFKTMTKYNQCYIMARLSKGWFAQSAFDACGCGRRLRFCRDRKFSIFTHRSTLLPQLHAANASGLNEPLRTFKCYSFLKCLTFWEN